MYERETAFSWLLLLDVSFSFTSLLKMDGSRMFCGTILSIFIIYTVKDVFLSTNAEKEIPVTKVGLSSNVGPTLKFFYW